MGWESTEHLQVELRWLCFLMSVGVETSLLWGGGLEVSAVCCFFFDSGGIRARLPMNVKQWGKNGSLFP